MVEPSRLGFGEAGIAGEIGLAAGDIHGQPRDPELLAPGAVSEQAHLCDREHMLQESEVVRRRCSTAAEPATRLGLGHPAELALDLADEGLNAGGGGLRLLLLERDEGLLVLEV